MRMSLTNYLALDGNTINDLADQVLRSRETIRRWRDDKSLTTIVHFDSRSGKVDKIEKGKLTTIKGGN